MTHPTGHHTKVKINNLIFNLLNGQLLVLDSYCDKCDQEFFRPPTLAEIHRAKELGIIK